MTRGHFACLVALLLFVVGSEALLTDYEYSILSDLFTSANGADWTWAANSTGAEWSFSGTYSDPCGDSWQGVTCSDSAAACSSTTTTCNLIGLALPGYNLNGSLPTSLAQLNYSQTLDLSSNAIQGSLPAFGSVALDALLSLEVSSNELTSSLPSSLCAVPSLRQLNAQQNSLGGSLPACLGDALTQLQVLNVGFNALAGPNPLAAPGFPALVYYNAESNALTGPVLPTSGSTPMFSSSLQHLLVNSNKLSGSFPTQLGSLTALLALDVSSNSLDGTLPALDSLTLLTSFSAASNALQGPLGSVFGAQSALTSIDVTDNGLTGTIPSDMFSLAALQIFAAGSNCMWGAIPSEVCNAQQLQTLSLNGLFANPRFCRGGDVFFAETPIANVVEGGLPSCVWTELPALRSLHVAVNGLMGPLDGGDTTDSATINPLLENVSVSNNRFTGSVPASLQQFSFNFIDISHNKISGTGASLLSSSSNVTYTINRLSGLLPKQFEYTANVNVLLGNLFNCDAEHPLPANDPEALQYNCGSTQLDQAMIIMGGTTVIALCLLGLYRYYERGQLQKHRALRQGAMRRSSTDSAGDNPLLRGSTSSAVDAAELSSTVSSGSDGDSGSGSGSGSRPFLLLHYYMHLLDWLSFRLVDMQKNGMHHLHHFVVLLHLYRRMSTVMFGFMLVVVLPTYLGMKYDRDARLSSHEYQYGWTSTSAFLSGVTPATVVMVLWFVLTYYMLAKIQNISTASSKSSHEWHRLEIDEQLAAERARKLREQRQNKSAAGGSTKGKGRGAIDTSSIKAEDLVDLKDDLHDQKTCMARLRLLWTTLGLLGINVIIVLVVNIGYVDITISNRPELIKILAQLALAGFNQLWGNVVVPLCIQAISVNIEVLATNPAARVRLHVLILLFNAVMAPCIAAASTNPICFQGLFVEAAPVVTEYPSSYCSSYLFDPATGGSACATISEVISYSALAPAYQYYYQCGSALIVSYVPVYIYAYVGMGFLLPLIYGFLAMYDLATLPIPGIQNCFSYHVLWPRDTEMPPYDLLRADDLISYFMYHFAMLMTFGLASPALAFVIWITICVTTYQWEILIARYLKYSPRSSMTKTVKSPSALLGGGSDADAEKGDKKEDGEASQGEDRSGGLEESCKLIWKGPMKAVWIIIWGSALFFAAMLFDMAGDFIGWYSAMSVWVIMLALPVAMFLSSSRAILVIQSKTPPSVKLFCNTMFVTLHCDVIWDWYVTHIVRGHGEDIRESLADGAEKIRSVFSCKDCGKTYRRWRNRCCGRTTRDLEGSASEVNNEL